MSRHYCGCVLHTSDGKYIDVPVYTSGVGWGPRLRAFRKACERMGHVLKWGDWAYIGGNMWSYSDIANA